MSKITFTLDLTKEEHAGLKALCSLYRISIKQMLEAFVADATSSDRRGGSDEADRATAWFDRRCFSFESFLASGESEDKVGREEVERRREWYDRWTGAAYSARQRERANWAYWKSVIDANLAPVKEMFAERVPDGTPAVQWREDGTFQARVYEFKGRQRGEIFAAFGCATLEAAVQELVNYANGVVIV